MFRSLRGGVFWSILLTSLTFALVPGLNPENAKLRNFWTIVLLQAAFFLESLLTHTNGLAAPHRNSFCHEHFQYIYLGIWIIGFWKTWGCKVLFTATR